MQNAEQRTDTVKKMQYLSKPGMSRFAALCLSAFLLTGGCSGTATDVPPPEDAELLPGGATTTSILPFPALDKMADNLPAELKADFYAGRALAEQPWVKAPTITTARDGLGPVYNARACLACHIRGGKGRLPDDSNTPLFNVFLRLSIPADKGQSVDETLGVIPEPTYGDQLQTQSIALAHQLRRDTPDNIAAQGDVAPEAYVYIEWEKSTFTYPDGQQAELRQPSVDIRYPAYGALHPHTLMSLRNAPAIHGMGLLELIPQRDINALADPDDSNHDGISGRINQVWDAVQQKTVPGRFGLKANRPNMDMVVASAFANDIGISNPLFPQQPCTDNQPACARQINGNGEPGFELPAALMQLVTDFSRNLAVPERRDAADPQVHQGRTLFYQSGCQACHQPSYTTGDSAEFPHLANQKIWPYSDLLLHDMGAGLADKRPDFLASGSEWRTPPLWGAGLLGRVNGSNSYLHDGRARSIEEAILWHGGEATAVRQNFIHLTKTERQALIKFVESL